MKNFTLLIVSSFFLFSCSKHSDWPSTNSTSATGSGPSTTPPPVSNVSITINGQAMNITSLSYQRHRSGEAGSFSITASNAFQKVTAAASPFSQYNPPWSMIYVMEVSYFLRKDSLSGWGTTLPRITPRDDRIYFNTADPLDNKTVTGSFSGTFIELGGTKEEQFIVVSGNFTLAF